MPRIGGEDARALEHAECSYCKAPIYWAATEAGARVPLERGKDERFVVDGHGVRSVLGYKRHRCPHVAGPQEGK